MKFRFAAIALLATGFNLIFSPSGRSQSLNEALNSAICAQDWSRALQTIQEIKQVSPEHAAQLTTYQSRLQNLATRGFYLPGWNCSGGGLPTASAIAPAQPSTSGVFRVPIKEFRGGTPVVEVTFNGTDTFPMLFDTGATTTLILPSMANKLKLETLGNAEATVADGRTKKVNVARVNSLKVGDLEVNDVTVTFDLRADEASLEGIGLLGQNVFQHYDISLKKEEIEFRERSD
ncbi:retropepsin-like aspartic protease [Spirulina sp. 06S082]|uniref:retropepsin-like aspartic protease family protein n=1 Tax=Spirulina sp. 06S082 TaxID=3110248 RepID=UPI002B21B9F6|nr:retropepsin-like aspartic protease [Spirulina sp. 06S082]MEA5467543.1 retropepsin-like aspartic protease [Spirulina sp. 06S082]